ncbi:hypothetical protein V9T40_009320 [Parthenolecanium corni]|uniref:GOST seven transmembrane domain-containing protein n=1 Tax=Parthenolecanium corni TaxID=536013 RepID=A0AAN9Y816_9HEMI
MLGREGGTGIGGTLQHFAAFPCQCGSSFGFGLRVQVASSIHTPQSSWLIYPDNCIVIPKALFLNSVISVRVSCNESIGSIRVQTKLEESDCYGSDIVRESALMCQAVESALTETSKNSNETQNILFNCAKDHSRKILFRTSSDGFFVFVLKVGHVKEGSDAKLFTDMKGPHGYLSAEKWPLLHFYGFMCIVYGIYAVVWFVVSFMQWRDLLRIQFWIGAVILIGMIEKAMFYEEYESVNSTGESSLLGTEFAAELVSAAKRSLARMLVIIVSLGYGIVKPRLGSHLPRIMISGILYFTLASTEAYFRVVKYRSIRANELLISGILLALLDSFICWWIFSSLIQTTRTLRLRRNITKLQLYNYFTNTLIFAVIASTIFMLYSLKSHRIVVCFKDWKDLWIDDAFWHLLFSIILLVIMILWRPTNNNQRYAFSPLLDAPDDDESDDEIEHFVNDNYGVKMRGMGSNRSDSPRSKNALDDDLKWVEENIPPSFIDSTLPILDSDEELMNTKFEMSKME